MSAEEVNDSSASAKSKQKPQLFKPGQSGNPKGRAVGTRNKATMEMQAFLDGEGKRLSRKAVIMALEGDTTALRICMERVLPPRKDVPVRVQFNRITKMSDAVDAQSAILEAACNGEITPSEATALSNIAQQAMKAIELQELSERISKLEDRI